MAKRIDRTRVDAGRYELPKKLAFLQVEKVDYVAIVDRDGDLAVELGAKALSKLVKARGELKAMKAVSKTAAAAASQALQAEEASHAETQAALAQAERRIKSLQKKLDAATQSTTEPRASKPAKAASGAVSEADERAARSQAEPAPVEVERAQESHGLVGADPLPATDETDLAHAARIAVGSEAQSQPPAPESPQVPGMA
jgi:hypothetical protein